MQRLSLKIISSLSNYVNCSEKTKFKIKSFSLPGMTPQTLNLFEARQTNSSATSIFSRKVGKITTISTRTGFSSMFLPQLPLQSSPAQLQNEPNSARTSSTVPSLQDLSTLSSRTGPGRELDG